MKKKHLELAVITVIYLFTLFMWSLPLQDNQLPYGEVDAAAHFSLGDYMAQTDKPLVELPYYISVRYGRDNLFIPNSLFYPPPYHTNFAIMQIVGGERIVPIFLFNTILSSFIVLAGFFIMRKLFGFWPATISALFLAFSLRDIMIYLWGQWPERISYYYTPVILYCFYKYLISYNDGNQRLIYMYLTALFLTINLFLHPAGVFHSVGAMAVFYLLLALKHKKAIMFDKKHAVMAIIIFVLFTSIFPSQVMNVLVKSKIESTDTSGDFSSLFSWFRPLGPESGFPPSYFSYKEMVGGYWTIPLLLAGIIFLALRRKDNDLLMLAWLISLYIFLHLDFLGKGSRGARSLSATAHIFYPLISIGTVYFFNMVRVSKPYKNVMKYILITAVIILAIFFNGQRAYSQLDNAYSGVARLTPAQYAFAESLKDNTPEDAQIYDIGTASQPKNRWMWMIANRYLIFTKYSDKKKTHVLLDYSDARLMGNKNFLNQLASIESQLSADPSNKQIYKNDQMTLYMLGGTDETAK